MQLDELVGVELPRERRAEAGTASFEPRSPSRLLARHGLGQRAVLEGQTVRERAEQGCSPGRASARRGERFGRAGTRERVPTLQVVVAPLDADARGSP